MAKKRHRWASHPCALSSVLICLPISPRRSMTPESPRNCWSCCCTSCSSNWREKDGVIHGPRCAMGTHTNAPVTTGEQSERLLPAAASCAPTQRRDHSKPASPAAPYSLRYPSWELQGCQRIEDLAVLSVWSAYSSHQTLRSRRVSPQPGAGSSRQRHSSDSALVCRAQTWWDRAWLCRRWRTCPASPHQPRSDS